MPRASSEACPRTRVVEAEIPEGCWSNLAALVVRLILPIQPRRRGRCWCPHSLVLTPEWKEHKMLNTIKWLALLPLVPPISGAKAQQRPATDFTGQDMTPAVVLARVCVKEASFTGFADCPPIASVLLRVGRGDVVRGAKLYSPRVFDPARLGRRPWIAQLRADGSQPEGWPENISWRNHRPSWERMVSLARAVLEGPGEAPCAPDHWGGPMDHHRAVRNGWVQLDCGPTVNEFWQVPRRSPRISRVSPTPRGVIPARIAAGRHR